MKRTEDRRGVIGQNIKLLREKQKMSQTQLAGMLWIDRTSLSGYEIGKRIPDIFMLWKMADVFGVSLDVLVGRENGNGQKEREDFKNEP